MKILRPHLRLLRFHAAPAAWADLRSVLLSALVLPLLAASPFSAWARPLTRVETAHIDSMMEQGVANGWFPGASIAIGDRSGVRYAKCYGHTDNQCRAEVCSDDVYDLASCTKIVATTLAVMRLYDRHLIDPGKCVGDYIDLYDASPVSRIPLSALLTHTSGLPDVPFYTFVVRNPTGGRLLSTRYDPVAYPWHVDRSTWLCAGAVCVPEWLVHEPRPDYRRAGPELWVNPAVDTLLVSKIIGSYSPALRGHYRYSDVNFVILRQIVERISGEPFSRFCGALFAELEMRDTGFTPRLWKDTTRIIPTEVDRLLGRGLVVGYPHDETAALAPDGAEGNAGLFSNVEDLSHFCRMLMDGGRWGGRQVIARSTVALFTASPLAPRKIYRGLGFDKATPDSPLWGGFGHTGYTGTMIWIDPVRDLFFVFLSNRVNPSRLNTGLITSGLRTKIWEYIKGK